MSQADRRQCEGKELMTVLTPVTVIDQQELHLAVIFQPCEKLRRDEEVPTVSVRQPQLNLT